MVAIAIPVFTTQLEKSREATDAANIRSAYAEVTAAALANTKTSEGNVTYDGSAKTYTITVTVRQATAGWSTTPDLPAAVSALNSSSTIVSGQTVTIVCDENGNVTSATVA
ncbi:MAG: hypothetical protein K5853_06120 [Lachnospiraceae bacterium]|nr:hypothetical protein [Lachnospiraceae bacterium]